MKTTALLLALWLSACVDAVRSGLPPLVQGCRQDSDCPAFGLCADGGCEEWTCLSSCDCPGAPASFGCVPNAGGVSSCVPGQAPTYPCTLPDGGAGYCATGACDAG